MNILHKYLQRVAAAVTWPSRVRVEKLDSCLRRHRFETFIWPYEIIGPSNPRAPALQYITHTHPPIISPAPISRGTRRRVSREEGREEGSEEGRAREKERQRRRERRERREGGREGGRGRGRGGGRGREGEGERERGMVLIFSTLCVNGSGLYIASSDTLKRAVEIYTGRAQILLL
jgi:hypothetical protein